MAIKDRIYKCLNPLGIQEPVDLYPLAPRLDTLDGKTIYLNLVGSGEQDITIPLEKKLKSAYPNVNWRTKKSYGPPVGGALSDEEIRTSDALIQGVAW